MENLIQDIIEEFQDDALVQQKVKKCYEVSSGQNAFLEDVIPPETEMQKKIKEETLLDPDHSGWIGMMSGHQVGMTLYACNCFIILIHTFRSTVKNGG